MKRVLAFTLIVVSTLLIANFASAQTNPNCPAVYLDKDAPYGCPGAETIGDNEYTPFMDDMSYRRMHYTFGVGGSYFAKQSQTDIKGNVGAYTNFEYRFLKVLSFGFDTFYGYNFGDGNQYISLFNPGVKIFPMMYKNPNFQPYIFLGAHAFNGVMGSSAYGNVGMAQGGFAGAGFRLFPGGSTIGFEFFTRASFLWAERPEAIGGRTLTIPIFGFVGIVY